MELIQFGNIYANRKIMITGHTGFKGSWLALWLSRLGADILGYSLPPPTIPNHFDLLGLNICSVIDDIMNYDKMLETMARFEPELVYHMAAQPIVSLSYSQPRDTFLVNAMGTVNVLEACRKTKSVKAVLIVTSDKCYENSEQAWGYKEEDKLGGNDPYSCSKACTELIASSYRKSYFSNKASDKIFIATARAGNVIGGGDWGENRLVPDIIRSITQKSILKVRNPDAIRPWQHVLNCLSGYLLLGRKLLLRLESSDSAWNFGPEDNSGIKVNELVGYFKEIMDFNCILERGNFAETHSLMLNSAKAREQLLWEPVWSMQDSIHNTALWYKEYMKGNIISDDQLNGYFKDAKLKGVSWIS